VSGYVVLCRRLPGAVVTWFVTGSRSLDVLAEGSERATASGLVRQSRVSCSPLKDYPAAKGRAELPEQHRA
jgi:hypothetical protein